MSTFFSAPATSGIPVRDHPLLPPTAHTPPGISIGRSLAS